jgi:hypothetical protein
MKNLAAHIEQQFREKAIELRIYAGNHRAKRSRFLNYARQFEYLAEAYQTSRSCAAGRKKPKQTCRRRNGSTLNP